MPPVIVPQDGTVAASQPAVHWSPVWLYFPSAFFAIGLTVAVYFAVKALMRRLKVKIIRPLNLTERG